MKQRGDALSKSAITINFPIVFRVMGWLLMIESCFMLCPLAIAFVFDEVRPAISFGATVAVTFIAGALMAYRINPSNKVMRRREGLMLTAMVWFVFSLFGMLPYLLSGLTSSFTHAYFETMSGFTTTGMSIIPNIEHMPRSIVFWRSMTQWIGGMGIILFTLAVLPMLNFKGGVSLFNSEVTGITHERMRPRVSATAKSLWGIYLSMTVIMLGLLLLGPMNWFDALCHTMSTVSTGGFSTKNDALHYWNDTYTDSVIGLFMFLCGINFTLLFNVVVRGRVKLLLKSDTFRWYCSTMLAVSCIIFIRSSVMGFGDGVQERLSLSLFDTISAITSTGFSTVSYETSGEFISFILVTVMFFGGMAGSTSGGAKIDRFVVLIRNVKNEFYKVVHSNAVTTVRLEGKSMPHHLVEKVIAFLAIYVLVIVVGALLLTMMGIPMFDSLFSSMSMISNVGMGYGCTSTAEGLAALPFAAKWLMCFEMVVGRLELFTVLVIFTKAFWVRD